MIADCIANQQVTGNYTLAQLRHALNTLSPTTKEYTNCYDAINRAIAAKVGTNGGNGSSNSSGGSFLPTPLIIVLVVLVLAAGGYGVLAWRRREQSGGGDARQLTAGSSRRGAAARAVGALAAAASFSRLVDRDLLAAAVQRLAGANCSRRA